jgi:hypothetical protein
MNLYATSPDPKKCAEYLDTKRLGWSAIKESAQLISTAIWELWQIETPVKPTHANHPVAVWVRECPENLSWAVRYMKFCNAEYYHRKLKIYHVNSVSSFWLSDLFSNILLEHHWYGTINTPENFCNHAANKKLGIDYTNYEVHRAYRIYLSYRWTHTDKVAPQWD